MPSGFFYIDKPMGMTSHTVVSRMRKVLGMKKVGHSGTLDPMATGVLIIACGTSTRLLDYVQAGTKEYLADVQFGVKTSTGDREGDITESKDMSGTAQEDIEKVLPQFIGNISQIPPMVSAIKVDGKKLYEYEREGVVIERKPREVIIDSIELESFTQAEGDTGPQARLRISCHAGTYIRTLAEDIASELGGYAHLIALRRTRNGNVSEQDLVDLPTMQSSDTPLEFLKHPTEALQHFAQIEFDEEQTMRASHGKTVSLTGAQMDIVDESSRSEFLGFGHQPSDLVAMFKKGEENPKSHCVVFLDL